MSQQLIHVKIGLIDAVYPVRKLITSGPMHDMFEFQQDAHTIGWVHKQWCTPVTAPQASNSVVPCHGLQAAESVTTDWRAYLRSHWDAEHNHLRTDCLNDFYTIFRRAAADYIKKQYEQTDKTSENKTHHQHGGDDTRRADQVHDKPCRPRPAATMPSGDKTAVREARKQVKPVQLSLFDF